MSSHKLIFALVLILTVIALVVLVNFLVIRFNGKSVQAPEIPRGVATIGSGEKLNYAIFGDSTSISQGGEYQNGYAVNTAEYLSQNRQVSYQNFGVSGARISDVANSQIPQSSDFKADLALIAVGANDVTHLTSLKRIESDMNQIIDELQAQNPNMTIIFTGSASMGTVKRFPQPTRFLAGLQTNRVNQLMENIAQQRQVVFAHIARDTEEAFRNNPQHFSQDNFHPSDSGYAVWTEILISVIDSSIPD
jgi:lysophospholipase L1-like esterase